MSFEISEANYKTSMHWTNELVANACLITGSLKLILDLNPNLAASLSSSATDAANFVMSRECQNFVAENLSGVLNNSTRLHGIRNKISLIMNKPPIRDNVMRPLQRASWAILSSIPKVAPIIALCFTIDRLIQGNE